MRQFGLKHRRIGQEGRIRWDLLMLDDRDSIEMALDGRHLCPGHLFSHHHKHVIELRRYARRREDAIIVFLENNNQYIITFKG